MSGTSDMVADSVQRLFGDLVTQEARDRFAAGGDFQPLWDACAAAGLDRATAAEAAGGIGATLCDAYPLLHAVGHHAAPVPLAESLVAHALLAAGGIAPPDEGLLVPLDTCALPEPLQWTRRGAGPGRVRARIADVPWGRAARWGVVATDTAEGPCTLLVDLRRGATATARAGMAPALHADLLLEGAEVIAAAPGRGPGGAQPVRVLGALARCAQMVGALEQVLAIGVDYAAQRVQFGRPIGQNQAVQQMLASVAGQVAATRTATLVALAAPTGAEPRVFDVAVAKVRAGEAAGVAAAAVHQVLGAIGFTQEHHLHHFTQRLWAWRAEFGSDAYWARELGRRAIAAGAEALWPMLVARRPGSAAA